MSMNNYPVDERYRNMLNSFRFSDLQTLLGTFGQNKVAQKSELKDQAIELLRNRPVNFNYSAYIEKIHEIYSSLHQDIPSNNIMMRSLLQNQQQRRMISIMGQIQNSPQYLQQSMHMVRAGIPQVMPQMESGMYGNQISNSIPVNNMVNNNIHYIAAGINQPSGTQTIVSHQLPPNQQTSIVAQNALGLRTIGSGNNPYTPSVETVAQIKFKNLLFYEVIDEVIKPTLLTGADRCTLQNVPRDMKEATLKFILSLEHANFIAKNRNISHGKNEYQYQFQIRICQLIEPVLNESPDYMPLGLHIRVGRNTCLLPSTASNTRARNESRRITRPINCTENVKLSPIVNNNITINWTSDEKNYVFAMYLVKKITVDTLIQKLKDKGGRSSEETKNYIIKKLADVDPDLATTSYRFSLMCPLEKIKMKIPVKSIHCDHLQCFDASAFILMNEKKPTWMCPICNKPCLYNDIQIENYFLEVLSSATLKDCSQEIDIFADGTWRIYEETKETNNTNSTPDRVKPIVSVDSDSDDKKCIESKTEPESSRTQEPENIKSSFINLTLSDDEELPTEKDKQKNKAQAADDFQPVAVVDLKPQAQVQPQQAVPSSEQGTVIEIDSQSPLSSPTPTTEAS